MEEREHMHKCKHLRQQIHERPSPVHSILTDTNLPQIVLSSLKRRDKGLKPITAKESESGSVKHQPSTTDKLYDVEEAVNVILYLG